MLYLTVLYAMLDDPSFSTREAAERELVHIVSARPWQYGERLAALSRDCSSPEVAFRVGRPLRVYDSWRANSYVPKSVPVWPIVDAMFVPTGLGDVRVRAIGSEWLSRAEQEGNDSSGPYWFRYRRATELMIRDAIRRGMTYAEADELLGRMYAVERRAKSDTAPQWQEEIESWSGRPWAGGYPQPEGE